MTAQDKDEHPLREGYYVQLPKRKGWDHGKVVSIEAVMEELDWYRVRVLCERGIRIVDASDCEVVSPKQGKLRKGWVIRIDGLAQEYNQPPRRRQGNL